MKADRQNDGRDTYKATVKSTLDMANSAIMHIEQFNNDWDLSEDRYLDFEYNAMWTMVRFTSQDVLNDEMFNGIHSNLADAFDYGNRGLMHISECVRALISGYKAMWDRVCDTQMMPPATADAYIAEALEAANKLQRLMSEEFQCILAIEECRRAIVKDHSDYMEFVGATA